MVSKSVITALVVLVAVLASSDALRVVKQGITAPRSSIPAFKTFYMTQKVDHFNFRDPRTFQMRYLLNDDYFSKDGPVFFYAGNEGDIEGFWNNTGFMFDIAPIFQAMVVFPEHRYYGKTLPFGQKSFDLNNIGYLSVEQTLADYALFLNQLRANYSLSASRNPIIAFGGSYGGILAAYMRYKYPNLVQGSLAASAPIYLTSGNAPSTLFFSDVTNDFKKEPGCEPLVRKAFSTMQDLHAKGDYTTLTRKMQLCKPLSNDADFKHLLLWARNAFTIMAMVDYPYPASFLGNLPAWPVHAACEQLTNDTARGIEILTAFKNMVGILYNDSSNCFDIYAQFIECADPTSCGLGNDASAWDYQVCTELNTVQETNGVTDMFPVLPYDEAAREAYCKKTWNVTPSDEWITVQYWGRDIKTATNIVFSNGLLDPWHQGGPQTDLSDSLKAIIVADGAHHLDLRGSDPADPESVRNARYLEILEIIKWIKGARDSQ